MKIRCHLTRPNCVKTVPRSQNCLDNGSEEIFVDQWIRLLLVAAVAASSRHITIHSSACWAEFIHKPPPISVAISGFADTIHWLVHRAPYWSRCVIQHGRCVRASVLVSSVLLSLVQIFFFAHKLVRRYTFFLFLPGFQFSLSVHTFMKFHAFVAWE
jgi:transcriptional regulator of nitric oxide reductase